MMVLHYQITVKEYLDDSWSSWFDGLTIIHDADGMSTLAGPVRDQAALYGLLDIESVLAPYWHCGDAIHMHSMVDALGCWPPLRPTTQRCTCAIERKPAKTHTA